MGVDVYQWLGEVDDFAATLHRVGPTGMYAVTVRGERREFVVPSRGDYENRLRRARTLDEDERLESRPELVAAVQAHWHAAGHNSCLFASFMSEERAKYGWETWVLSGGDDLAEYASTIRAVVAPRIAAPEAEVVSVLLPTVDAPADLVTILRELARDATYRLADYGVEHDAELGAVQRLGLTVDVGDDHWSEVLGFGPAAPLAYTRRAPFTELAIRAKPPTEPERDRRSFMANIDIDLKKPEFAEFWRETKRQRTARLGDEHNLRGKARVTTVVPVVRGPEHD